MTPEDLVEIHRIQRLKYRYVRGLDQKLFDDVEACFTPDATASYGGGAYVFESRDGIMEFLRSAMGSTTMLSSHRVGQPEIELVGPDEATGTWALDDVVLMTDLGITVRGAAFYDDRYVKVGGEWRIKHTGYKRTYEELFPRASIAGLELTAHWWDTNGRSKLG
jgi:hypothetical protein